MSHTIKKKTALLARVGRLRGQLEAVDRALTAEAPCGEVLQLLASVRGALNGLTAEVLEDHLREHIVDETDTGARHVAGEEFAGVIRTYLR